MISICTHVHFVVVPQDREAQVYMRLGISRSCMPSCAKHLDISNLRTLVSPFVIALAVHFHNRARMMLMLLLLLRHFDCLPFESSSTLLYKAAPHSVMNIPSPFRNVT